MNKLLKVKCPQCDTVFEYYQSAFRPFCSERCKMIDLGHWFEETYVVPDKEHNNNEKQESDEENYDENDN